MQQLTELLDEIFDNYGVSDADRARVAEAIAAMAGGQIADGGEDDFVQPEMGYGAEEDDAEAED